ncbi:MAG TPA: STAS domain-containing protein [bacterium]|nr:STAS domain-containing protein [bacterium]HQL63869.1 STAS domain-containing protein [bacterium]
MIPIEREDVGDVSILKLSGELDFENTVWLRGELHGLLKEGRVRILLNMKEVDLISSYTVGVFVAFARDLRERGGDIKFLHLLRRVRDTFAATRIDHILDIFEDRSEAIAAFSKS